MKKILLIFILGIVMFIPSDGLAQGKLKVPTQKIKEGNYISTSKIKGEEEFLKAHRCFQNNEYDTALYWLKKAANLGHKTALNDLSLMYQYGIGIEADSDTALSYAGNNTSQPNKYLLHVAYELTKDWKEIWPKFFSYWREENSYFQPTIYFGLDSSDLTRENKLLLDYIFYVYGKGKEKIIITGWTDHFTGTAEEHNKICNDRVNIVRKYLLKKGYDPEKINVRIDTNNLTDFGGKGAPLDRAVTFRLDD